MFSKPQNTSFRDTPTRDIEFKPTIIKNGDQTVTLTFIPSETPYSMYKITFAENEKKVSRLCNTDLFKKNVSEARFGEVCSIEALTCGTGWIFTVTLTEIPDLVQKTTIMSRALKHTQFESKKPKATARS